MKRQAGFSLVELAVAIFIIGLIASMSFSTIKAQIINAAIRSTQGNQGAIKDALMAYLAKNKRLPCPAIDNLGAEGRDMSIKPLNCKTYYGLVPYVELGLPKSAAMDGWDNFFTYGISPQWSATYNTAPPDNHSSASATASFNVGVPGRIIVNDRNQTSGIAVQITTAAAAVVISQGANGYGAYTAKFTKNDPTGAGADEAANIPPPLPFLLSLSPPTYYKRDFTSNTSAQGGAFDDVVMVINPSDLLTPLMKDGALQSADGQWSDQISKINDVLATSMFTNINCAPPAGQPSFTALLTANGIPTVDPWGGTLSYIQLITQMKNNGTVTPPFPYPYSIITSTPGKTIFVPSNVTLYKNYQGIIQSTCP